jgi:hypothetical protein
VEVVRRKRISAIRILYGSSVYRHEKFLLFISYQFRRLDQKRVLVFFDERLSEMLKINKKGLTKFINVTV